jgi:hypothetical protein
MNNIVWGQECTLEHDFCSYRRELGSRLRHQPSKEMKVPSLLQVCVWKETVQLVWIAQFGKDPSLLPKFVSGCRQSLAIYSVPATSPL